MRSFPDFCFRSFFSCLFFTVPGAMFLSKTGIPCSSVASAVLFAHVLAACICDLRCGRIPNSLILCGILCGTVFRLNEAVLLVRTGVSVCPAAACLAQGFAGFLFPFIVLSLLALLKMIGAGDVKLLAVIGLFSGPKGSFLVLLYSIFAGGVISVFLVWKRKNLYARMQYFFLYLGQALQTRELVPYRTGGEKSGEFAFSLPILAGLLIYGFRQLIR